MAHPISFDTIVRGVALVAGIAPADLIGPDRHRPLVRPRQRAMLLARRIRPDLSLPNIGRRMGGRDHTTVLYGAARVERRLQEGEQDELNAVAQTLQYLGLDRLPERPDMARPRAMVAYELSRVEARAAQLRAELEALGAY